MRGQTPMPISISIWFMEESVIETNMSECKTLRSSVSAYSFLSNVNNLGSFL